MADHSRQERFAPIGPAGQARIRSGTAVVVGCGALGAACADMLARAGVGRLRLIDRDVVEDSNLQRQTLFDADDVAAGRPKAVAAARRLLQVDPSLTVEPVVGELRAANACALLDGATVVLDGTDHFPVRHLINDACCRLGIPWIHGACVGAYGVSLPITPGEGPCFRCLQDQLPTAGESPTCDSAGIIAPAVQLVAAWQVAEALKLLSGARDAVRRELWACDLWSGRFQRLGLAGGRDPACPSCGPQPTWPALSVGDEPAVTLCGRDAVQVRLPTPVDLTALGQRLGTAVDLANEFLVRWHDGPVRLTAFADGRVLVQGESDPVRARSRCDRWLG